MFSIKIDSVGSEAEMLVDCQDEIVDFCVLRKDPKSQIGFCLNVDEWELLKAFVDRQIMGASNNASTRTGSHSAAQADTVKLSGSGNEPEPSNSARR